jgi:hypothetical protein
MIQKDEPTTFSIKSMITMITAQWYFSSKYSLSHLNSLIKNVNECLPIFLSTYNHIEGKWLKLFQLNRQHFDDVSVDMTLTASE